MAYTYFFPLPMIFCSIVKLQLVTQQARKQLVFPKPPFIFSLACPYLTYLSKIRNFTPIELSDCVDHVTNLVNNMASKYKHIIFIESLNYRNLVHTVSFDTLQSKSWLIIHSKSVPQSPLTFSEKMPFSENV